MVGCGGITRHNGDGAFTETSQWFFPHYCQGYRIDFESFDLATGQNSEFNFSNVPNVENEFRNVVLCVDGGCSWAKKLKASDASVYLEIIDLTAGDQVFSYESKLKDLIWAEDGDQLYGYDDGNFWGSVAEGEYKLRVVYCGDQSLKTTANVQIRCGGSL